MFNTKKKQKLIEWERLITRNPSITKPHLSEQQLLYQTTMIVNSCKRIIDDSVKLVNHTLTPSVFFARYQTLFEEAAKIAKYEPFYPFLPPLPSEQLQMLIKKM